MKQCFLIFENFRVDLTEGNDNGKNSSIEDFLFTKKVEANISEKDEYLIYRDALKESILKREEMKNIEMNRYCRQGRKVLYYCVQKFPINKEY